MKVVYYLLVFFFLIISIKLYNLYELEDDEDFLDTMPYTQWSKPTSNTKSLLQIKLNPIDLDKFNPQNLSVNTVTDLSQAAFIPADQLSNLCIECAERNFFKCPNPDDPFIAGMCGY
jgi:hypothetical protein